MNHETIITDLYKKHVVHGNHAKSDYFIVIKELVGHRAASTHDEDKDLWQQEVDRVYSLIQDELLTNKGVPLYQVKFGTSGWRGILGKDFFCKSVAQVAEAIVKLYNDLEDEPEIAAALGVATLQEAKDRGCVLGFDNRFGGDTLARAVSDVLTANGFTVHYAGESTTGVLSAAVLIMKAAFSINLTPSHNPLQYAGFKFNAADAGPAAAIITDRITKNAGEIIAANASLINKPDPVLVKSFNSLDCWKTLVHKGQKLHGLDYPKIIASFSKNEDMVMAVDCVHGSSRIHIGQLLEGVDTDRLILVRHTTDPTFGGIAPEPSTANMETITRILQNRAEPLKLGMILDPDADRIRFTDGITEIRMNQFGAMAYHFLHEIKHKKGLVGKTVATSNFVNRIAEGFGEEIFESRVGFKEFKPVIHQALVCFEESDGITVLGHTPEKDAYIGLLLAMDMVLTLNMNLGAYLKDLYTKYGAYYPANDSIVVSQKGEELLSTLAGLKKYQVGDFVSLGTEKKRIVQIIDIDGHKMIFEDSSWLMIRPSGTEPKIRFYVEARTEEDKDNLFAAAKKILTKLGL